MLVGLPYVWTSCYELITFPYCLHFSSGCNDILSLGGRQRPGSRGRGMLHGPEPLVGLQGLGGLYASLVILHEAAYHFHTFA